MNDDRYVVTDVWTTYVNWVGNRPGGRWVVRKFGSSKAEDSFSTKANAEAKRDELNQSGTKIKVLPEKGDKVRVYGHIMGTVPSGKVGIYQGFDVHDNYPHRVYVDDDRPDDSYRRFARVELVESVKGRTAVDTYKQDVVLPAVDAAKKKHGLCDAGVDEFLKAVGIERPLPELPTGKNALIETNTGGVYRFAGGFWLNTAGVYVNNVDAQKRYKRTIFEGE